MRTASVPTRAGTLLFVAAALVAPACGNGGTSVDTSTTGRYCELAQQFDDIAVSTGAATAPGNYAADPGAAGRLLDQMGPTIDELRSSAPKEIRGDVKTTLDALGEARDGDTAALRSEKFGQAVAKSTDFRSRSCLAAVTSGEE